jgi:hypothetical protein
VFSARIKKERAEMREILFRGKTEDGEWVYGDVKHDYDGVPKAICDYCGSNPIIPETISEFTSLTDKNGKKIFEGDIVKVERDLWHGENKKEREVFNGAVWYDEKHTCFGLKSEKYRCLPIARFKGDYSTVIGNIHDNPELLKGE